MKKIFLILLFVLFSIDIYGANYYIDYDAGNDTNNGTTTGTAWKHFPGDPDATSNSNTKGDEADWADDVFYFKKGVTYITDAALVVKPGTSGHIATISSDASFGSGTAVVDGSNGQIFLFNMANYTTISNLKIQNIDATYPWDAAGVRVRNSHDVIISYVDVVGDSTETDPNTIYGISISESTYNVTVEYTTAKYCNYGMQISSTYATPNISVNYCESSYNDIDGFRTANQQTSTVTYYGCTAHHNGLAGCGGCGDGWDIAQTLYTTFKYCTSHDNAKSGFKLGISSIPNGSGVYVLYSIAYNNTDDGFLSNSAVGQTLYGNVAYDNDKIGFNIFGTAGVSETWTLKNNIGFDNGSYEFQYAPYSGNDIDADYNIWFDTTGDIVRWNGTTYTDQATYRAAVTPDEANTLFDNPDFNNPASFNFTLNSNSPAVNSGVDLGATYDDALDPINTDITTTPLTIATLDQDDYTSWDIGAFVALGGTVSGTMFTGLGGSSISEAQIVTGGNTFVVTLVGTTWVETDAQKVNLVGALDSDGAEVAGWDAVVKVDLDETDVVWTSSTVATITLPAYAGYDIMQNETISLTIPASCTALGEAIAVAQSVEISAVAAASTGAGQSIGYSATNQDMGYSATANQNIVAE